MQEIIIDSRQIGAGQPALIIGEVAQAHDGSINIAHAFIDAIADAGADAVKFQTHIAEAEGTSREEFRKSSPWNSETKNEFWKRTGFNEEQWSGLHRHARRYSLEGGLGRDHQLSNDGANGEHQETHSIVHWPELLARARSCCEFH